MDNNLPADPCDGVEYGALHVEHDVLPDALRVERDALGRWDDNGDGDGDVDAGVGAYVVHFHRDVVLDSSYFPLLFIKSL
jgi:hypothetical protein